MRILDHIICRISWIPDPMYDDDKLQGFGVRILA